eukprot:scaffold265533_cov28-Prasinocladus_malaysianus.AAC.2
MTTSESAIGGEREAAAHHRCTITHTSTRTPTRTSTRTRTHSRNVATKSHEAMKRHINSARGIPVLNLSAIISRDQLRFY